MGPYSRGAICPRLLFNCPSEEEGAGTSEEEGPDRVRAAPAVSRANAQDKTHMSIKFQRKHSGLPCTREAMGVKSRSLLFGNGINFLGRAARSSTFNSDSRATVVAIMLLSHSLAVCGRHGAGQFAAGSEAPRVHWSSRPPLETAGRAYVQSPARRIDGGKQAHDR